MGDKKDSQVRVGLEAYRKFFLDYQPTIDDYQPTIDHDKADCGNPAKSLTDKQRERLETLLDIAHKTRNFEIDLYWKRATYYWAFIVVIFGGYYTTLDHSKFLAILLSALGTIFTFGWYLANAGSKYWQENWEEHVNNLEILLGTPIHSFTKTHQHSWNPLKSYPFSVSKINQFLSFVLFLCWILLFAYSIYLANQSTINSWSQYLKIIDFIALAVALLISIVAAIQTAITIRTAAGIALVLIFGIPAGITAGLTVKLTVGLTTGAVLLVVLLVLTILLILLILTTKSEVAENSIKLHESGDKLKPRFNIGEVAYLYKQNS